MTEAEDRTVFIRKGETVDLILVTDDDTHRLRVEITGDFIGSALKDDWDFGTIKVSAYMAPGQPNADFVSTHHNARIQTTTIFSHSHMEGSDDQE